MPPCMNKVWVEEFHGICFSQKRRGKFFGSLNCRFSFRPGRWRMLKLKPPLPKETSDCPAEPQNQGSSGMMSRAESSERLLRRTAKDSPSVNQNRQPHQFSKAPWGKGRE